MSKTQLKPGKDEQLYCLQNNHWTSWYNNPSTGEKALYLPLKWSNHLPPVSQPCPRKHWEGTAAWSCIYHFSPWSHFAHQAQLHEKGDHTCEQLSIRGKKRGGEIWRLYRISYVSAQEQIWSWITVIQ